MSTQESREHILTDNDVLINSAAFNGQEFDGCPVDHVPDWLKAAIKSGEVDIQSPRQTDYAEFGVRNAEGVLEWAGPGDRLRFEDGKVRIIWKLK